jgi:hypothetical protein
MILEAAAITPRNEIDSESSPRISPPLESGSRQTLPMDCPSRFRIENETEIAKPFLAGWARNHPVVEQGGWLPADPMLEPSAADALPDSGSDSAPVRQLALRAIFGIDRELSEDEILERARALPGVLHLTRVPDHEVEGTDCARRFLAPMGFGGEMMKLVCGDRLVHFIREGNVLFLVQIAGDFAPGVRETLLIAARELDRG